ncbi:adenosylcobinamide-GDP ribazoletransferase [Nocardioides acrostichi]|uniref:adenosylcobinamide-GDP ribazoletransferase n=1 Tax=Nocardioides acrostichi TaxID=2784339 RepID=UPI001F1CB354|nr:adenosylcobinamide-GDP ribazoletransferase [Nocardioides acrostichi]
MSAVPVGAPRRVGPRTAGWAMLLAPVAVLPLALATTVTLLVARGLGLPPLGAGVLGVVALALGTRALHWDGLSDVADGLTASYDRERSLAVMRTGASGPAGTLAVVLVAGLQATGLATLAAAPPLSPGSVRGAVAAGLLVLVSRCSLTVCCARPVPAARAEGLGTTVAASVPVLGAVLSWVLALALLLALAPLLHLEPVRLVAVVASAAVVVLVLVRRCVVRLGGVTGDVLGAGVELALAVLLVGAAP